LTPSPPNASSRYFLDYEVSGVPHTLIDRCTTGQTAEQASDGFSSLIGPIGASFFSSTVVGMRYQEEGTDFSIDVPYTGEVTSWGSGAAGDSGTPEFAGMVSRANDGKKGKWRLFGYKNRASVGDFRFSVIGVEGWEDVYNYLQAETHHFNTIAGATPTWKSYVNLGVDAYWQRQMRKT